MSQARIIELFSMLLYNSVFAERGLVAKLGDNELSITKGGQMIGRWTLDGGAFVWSGPDQLSSGAAFLTVTEAAAYATNLL